MIYIWVNGGSMIKRIGLIFVSLSLTIILTACKTTKDLLLQEKELDTLSPGVSEVTETDSDEKCVFVGEWICLSKNSCNGKKIVLTITQENGQLNVIRDMESYSSSGSKIDFSVDVPTGNTFYSSNTKGTYTLANGVLTESFDNDRANYYTVTGELPTNICKFTFCYEECGDMTYCGLHDTDTKRYNSLTDSNKKTIGYYIKARYEYYDEINGGYAGDKYSDAIMQEAANKYGITAQQAYIIWMNYYSY